MLTLRVNWPGSTCYSVFSATSYLVEAASDHVRLLLDGDKGDIRLDPGSETYIMNASGSTIDKIRVRGSEIGTAPQTPGTKSLNDMIF